MECYFSQYELKWLDDLLPGKHADRPEDRERIIGKVSASAAKVEYSWPLCCLSERGCGPYKAVYWEWTLYLHVVLFSYNTHYLTCRDYIINNHINLKVTFLKKHFPFSFNVYRFSKGGCSTLQGIHVNWTANMHNIKIYALF